jgi:leader peptidase (prepilin peptidase)/N-methyltransferase
LSGFLSPDLAASNISNFLFFMGGKMILCWLLVALAVLDLENLWLPDWLTLPGAALGFLVGLLHYGLLWIWAPATPLPIRNGLMLDPRHQIFTSALSWLIGILAAPTLILLIRWLYRLIRRREGIGLGDAKLMILLAVWLGPFSTLLAFGLGVVLGALAAIVLLAIPSACTKSGSWAAVKLPLGSFLCVGGIVSSLWGQPILAAYLHWAGF